MAVDRTDDRRGDGPPLRLELARRGEAPLERRDDVLCYTSDPLEHDTEVSGPVEMVLYAASSAPDTDFMVRLTDVYPDGRSLVITEGVIRARYRLGLERLYLCGSGAHPGGGITGGPGQNAAREILADLRRV